MKIIKHPHNDQSSHPFMPMHEMMNRFFNDGFFGPDTFPMRALSTMNASFPKVDIAENEKEVIVTANIPGVNPEKVEIEVHDDIFSLTGSVEKQKEIDEQTYYRYEREYGQFHRSFALPHRVDGNNVSAKVKNGVLTVIMPKIHGDTKKKIKIETE